MDCGTYEFRIGFVIADDLSKAVKFINWKYETDFCTVQHLSNANGMCMKRAGYIPIIWLPKIPVTPEEIGVLNHELFHAICHCMRWASIPLGEDSEEAWCHLIKYVTKKVYQRWKR